MEKKHGLPFEIGQKAEAMSFQSGYRGAWFRCELKEISHRKGEIGAVLDYFDFPDEKSKWLKLYQIPPGSGGKPRERRRQLMLRPQYPRVFYNRQSFDVNAVSDVTVVMDGVWKVGDLVDWWTDGCYWSGRLTEILDNDKAQIELTPPPKGEGSSYEALLKDLRPSLEWSLHFGWTVPTSKDGRESRCCAQLIQPVKQAAESLPSLRVQQVVKGTEDMPVISSLDPLGVSTKGRKNSKLYNETLNQPPKATSPKESIDAPEITTQFIDRNNANGESSSSEGNFSSRVGDTSLDPEGQTAEDDHYCSHHLKKLKGIGGIPLNSTSSDTLEAALMDLEDLANNIKWMKRLLESGNAMRPPWEFVEHRGSSVPR